MYLNIMDENLYDEFGNYIGPEINELDGEDYDGEERPPEVIDQENENEDIEIINIDPNKEKYQVTLYEDKNFYPEAEEIFPGVENLVMEEDTQPLTEPIVPPLVTKEFDIIEKETPKPNFDFDFMAGLMTRPELVRNVALAGHLHHGKTTMLDLFIQYTHNEGLILDDQENLRNLGVRYTDYRKDEKSRGISIKSSPISLVLQSSRDKSYLVNFFDTPGHPNFSDEITSAFRMCDGVLLIVDVVEGITQYTEKLLIAAIKENLDIILCLNKIDRLILELKLPPADSYFKLKHTLDEYNRIIQENNHFNTENKNHFASPQLGNVIFSSSYYGILFTLESFALKYKELNGANFDTEKFSKFLWGDVYYENKKFTRRPTPAVQNRTFVQFILEPLYKIMGYAISEEGENLKEILNRIGINIKKSQYKLNPKPLLKLICSNFLGNTSTVIDVLIKNVVDAKKGSIIKIKNTYTGDKTSEAYLDVIQCKQDGILAVNVTKLYHKHDLSQFDAFGRVLSGTIKKGEVVKILGEKFTFAEQEDVTQREISNLWIYQSRYIVEIDKVPIGGWVLIEGLDLNISKTATITRPKTQMEIFKPLTGDFFNTAYMKVAVEPLNPSELPKMLEGLRKINKSYPLCRTKIEESGEHILVGTGELYMDCILHDLRVLYSEIEVKVSDPVVLFSETATETSSIKCYADSNNKKNRITMISEPLDKGLGDEIERGIVDMGETLTKKYSWDKYTVNSIWAFGPDKKGSNILLDYTLPSETDKESLFSIRDNIVQGFDWACREGPLIEEPIRNTKFKILDARVSSEPLFRAGGQIIPTSRRVCYSSFLMATPRIMEPILFAEVTCTMDCIPAVNMLLSRRRGHINSELPKPGTPFYVISAMLPALDSFGFETDLRTVTAGQAFCLTWFDHWGIMPGDPLDKTIELKPLEPSAPPQLAREALIKTRRRKGLLEDVTISKFFDDPILLERVRQDEEFKFYL